MARMLINFKTSQTPSARLDIKKSGPGWSLWAGEDEVEQVKVDDTSLGLDHYKVIVKDDGVSATVVRFADLHRHSDNSLMDGVTPVSVMVKRTEYAGALTDHGNMYGFLEYYKGMMAAGKHPIIGFEAYQEDLLGKLNGNHLILLAKNQQGYKNLLKLTSESFNYFHYKPHVTWEMLEKYHEGVICTSACLGGIIPSALMRKDADTAELAIKQFLDLFGEDFYLEIQRHGIDGEAEVNEQLLALGKKYGIPVIATTDSHYPDKEDAYAHEIELCLQTKKTMNEPHYTFSGTGYHLYDSEEMECLFADIPEVLDNTLRLAEKCEVKLKLKDVNLPHYTIPKGFDTPMDYFRHLCEEGFQRRFKGKPQLTDPKYKERFDYEMAMIEQMGFESYFIIVWDFIDYARRNNIYVGPGRGSAAGSLLAYCMGITDMDPIRFNLLFERFLNPERVSWPDIDTDIEHVGRPKVIDYITKKYGAESVCRIVTFGTQAAKMVIKDVARVLGYSPSWANSLAKLIPSEPHMTIAKAMDGNPELRSMYQNDADAAKVINVAKKLEGNKRHASQHACFDENTLITTETGVKRIADVQIGERVLTHKGRFKEVVNTITTETDMVYDVAFYGGKSVEVTGNHPLLIRHQITLSKRVNGSKTKVRVLDDAVWKQVQDIEKDDYVGIPVNQESVIPCIPGLPTSNPAFWWIVGRYIGDGWTEIYHRETICPNHTERRIIICCDKDPYEVSDIINHLEQCGFDYRVETGRTTKKIFLEPKKELYDYLQTFGRYAYGKFLNSDVLNLPVPLAGAFLEGYQSADGHYEPKGKSYSVRTVSEKLAMGVSLLINKVYHVATGFSICPAHIDIIEGRKVQAKTKYTISFILDDRPRKKYFYDDGCLWVRVKSVRSTSVENKKMYNLTVIGDSSYQANGIAAHNCGLVIAPGEVSNFLPTSMEKDKETGERSLTSQVTMTEVEDLSLIKMDLLGLKNLTAIHEVIDTVKRTRGVDTIYQDLPLDDRDTYVMLSKGMTGGVFQLEGEGMTNNVIVPMLADVETLPDDRMDECFERLIAAVALYRPGPMDEIPHYIEGMKDISKIHYLTPELESILRPTYGVTVYQEQVIQIVQKLAGYSLGRADVVRKAVGKKKHDVMEAEKEVFLHGNKDAFNSGKDAKYVPGCVENGIAEPIAQEIWSQMEKFASYAFNRSHAACYAWIASITAYMSCHWPEEFYCAMMNAFGDISTKVKGYMALAVKRGIKILPPDINKSEDKCTVEDGCIRLGFHALANLNKAGKEIITERQKNGQFKDYPDFYNRIARLGKKPTKKVLCSLIYAGALDGFGLNKHQLVNMIPLLEDNYKKEAVNWDLGQLSLFSAAQTEVAAPVVDEFKDRFLMEQEREAIGFYLTKHPVDELFANGRNHDCISITDMISNGLPDGEDEMRVTTYAILRDIKSLYTKNDEEMFFLTAEDRFNEIQCVLFPKRVSANKHRLEEGALVKLTGYFRIDEQRGPQLQIQDILSANEERKASLSSVIVTIRNREEQDKLMKFVREHPGRAVVQIKANNQLYPTNRAIQLTPGVMDFLKEHFASVET